MFDSHFPSITNTRYDLRQRVHNRTLATKENPYPVVDLGSPEGHGPLKIFGNIFVVFTC